MKYLFIDTASFYINIVITDNEKVLIKHTELNDNKLSERIFNIIEKVFIDADINVAEIKKIFVANGPGSFTGIRVGLTIAKTFAWAKKVPLIPVSTLELMVSGAEASLNMAVINDRNGYVYAGVYDNNLNCLLEDDYGLLDYFFKKTDPLTEYYSYEKFIGLNIKEPVLDFLKIINKHKGDRLFEVHLIAPNYIKKTEAEKSIDDQNH